MDRIFIKPATLEMKVRKPVNGHLAAEGEEVNAEGYWLRRIADGDVIVSVPAGQGPDPEATKAQAAPAKPSKSSP